MDGDMTLEQVVTEFSAQHGKTLADVLTVVATTTGYKVTYKDLTEMTIEVTGYSGTKH